ncbi:MAG: SurA N-terminal domain-containing protein [Thermodesulfovibrionales bacterium]
MKRINVQWGIGLVVVAIVLSGLSCAHRNLEKKDTVVTPVEHEKMIEQYRKGVEESKKIVVARVNGVAITLNDLLDRMNRIAPSYLAHGLPRTPEIDQKVKQEALDVLIFRELAVQEAGREGMKVDPEAVELAIETFKEDVGSEDAYRDYLRKRDITEETLKKEVERNGLFDMIAAKEILQKVKAEEDREEAVDRRKEEWEAELKKNATIEITLDAVEKKMLEDARKGNKE